MSLCRDSCVCARVWRHKNEWSMLQLNAHVTCALGTTVVSTVKAVSRITWFRGLVGACQTCLFRVRRAFCSAVAQPTAWMKRDRSERRRRSCEVDEPGLSCARRLPPAARSDARLADEHLRSARRCCPRAPTWTANRSGAALAILHSRRRPSAHGRHRGVPCGHTGPCAPCTCPSHAAYGACGRLSEWGLGSGVGEQSSVSGLPTPQLGTQTAMPLSRVERHADPG